MIITNKLGETFNSLFINLTAGYNREDSNNIAGDIVVDKDTHVKYTLTSLVNTEIGFTAVLELI